MFDFIYSILKRFNTNDDNKLDSFNFIRIIFLFFFVNLVVPFIVLYAKYSYLIEGKSSVFQFITFLIIGFVIMYPFLRVIYPGYKYLDKVKNYNDGTNFVFLVLLFLPSLLFLFLVVPNL